MEKITMSKTSAVILLTLFALVLFPCSYAQDKERNTVIVATPPPPVTPTSDVGIVEGLPANSPWLKFPPLDYVIPPYAKYLKGKKICLDPGHGGDAALNGFKMSSTGLREAEVNLKIARMLRDWLVQSGAIVYMTRDGDYDLSKDNSAALSLRAKVANDNQCDFFISLHHNYVDRHNANFPGFWYHDNPDYMYSAMDLGRYLCEAILEIMRHREPQNSGAYSDFLMFPNAGFGVLRNLTVPGVIIEASFYSNPDEDARLKNDEYLKREAYAYLLGIARYAASGFPTYELISPAAGTMKPTETIQIKLIDDVKVPWGAKGEPRLFTETIKLFINDYDVPFKYDNKSGILSFTPAAPMQPGRYKILVKFMNANKNSALPKFTFVEVQP